MAGQQGRSGAVNTGDSSSSPSSSSASTSSTKSGKKRSIEEIVDERLEILADKLQSKRKRKEGNFKYVSNKDQFEFNEDVLINLREANRRAHSGAKRNIKKAIKKLKKRNKLTKMADKSKAGWKIVQEYLTDEVAPGPEDDKRIRKCEKRALEKIAADREKKKSTKEGYSKPPGRFRNASQFERKSRDNDKCFRCGKKGHWLESCWSYKRKDSYGRQDRSGGF